MPIIHAPKEPELDGRHLLFPVVISLCFLVLLLRLWFLQVVVGPELAEKSGAMLTVSVDKLAPRGLIFDRTGKLIGGIQSKLVVTAVPADVDKNPGLLDRVAAILGTRGQRLRDSLSSAGARRHFPVPIFVGADIRAATRIAEQAGDMPGIAVESQPMRFYPDMHAFAHLLGYVWTPSDKDEERLKSQGLDLPAYVGKAGVEAFYDAILMGKPGAEQFEVNAKRIPIRLAATDNPTPGDALTLTIDADLHKFALGLLKGHKGAIVALEPESGEILCMASSPSFNVGPFIRGIKQDEFDELLADPGHPLINRAFEASALYSPGSTFKPVTTIAAMRAGVFDSNRVVVCPGYYQLGDTRIRCLGRHGPVTFERALTASCNTYFADLALRAGPDQLRRAALDCGFGVKSGLDLRGEGKGIVPTQEWIRRRRPDGRWYPGDTVNLGIGQGELAVTPLQMADLAALVANRGVIYKPHLLKARIGPGTRDRTILTEREIFRSVDLPAQQWSAIDSAMIQVIEHGTARVARIPGLIWAGKTGSAEKRGQHRTDSWFIGFAPAEDPKIAIAVMGEDVGHGAEFAAPIAREVVSRYLARSSRTFEKTLSVSSNQAKSSGRR